MPITARHAFSRSHKRLRDRTDVAIQAGGHVFAAKPQHSNVLTGFADLDRMTGGLRRESITALAGRASVGMSTLSLNIAEHIASVQR